MLAGKHQFELRFLGVATEADKDPGRGSLASSGATLVCLRGHAASQKYLREAHSGPRDGSGAEMVRDKLPRGSPGTMGRASSGCSRVGGVPDLIEEGKTGFFCDPLQAASLSGVIERVLLNPDLAATVARQAGGCRGHAFIPKSSRGSILRFTGKY